MRPGKAEGTVALDNLGEAKVFFDLGAITIDIHNMSETDFPYELTAHATQVGYVALCNIGCEGTADIIAKNAGWNTRQEERENVDRDIVTA